MVELLDFVIFPILAGTVLIMLAWAKNAIRKEITTTKVEAWLQSMGIRSVNAKFINELTKDGVQNLLNLYLGKMNIERAMNPMSVFSGLPKGLQGILAFSQAQKAQTGEVQFQQQQTNQ